MADIASGEDLQDLDTAAAGYQEYQKNMNESSPEKGRGYQVALCDVAIEENCIICLPTGSGKTFIALTVAKSEYLPKAIRQNKKIVFLANSIPLAFQQAEYFKKHISGCGEKYNEKGLVKAITGAMGTDDWNNDKWNEIFENTLVLVMIPEILRKALDHNFIKFDQINLLILDECHNAIKGDPMATIMKDYKNKRDNFSTYELPRVIGLTATIIKGNSNQIAEEVETIEKTMCGRAVTYREYTEVLSHSTKAYISVIPFKSVPRDTKLVTTEHEIITLLEQASENIKKSAKLLKDSREETLKIIDNHNLQSTSQMHNKNKMLTKSKDITSALNDVKKIFAQENPMGLGLYAGRLAARQKIAFLQAMVFDEKGLDDLRLQAEEVLRKVVAYCDIILIGVNKAKQTQVFVSAKVDKLYKMLQLWNYTVGKDEALCGIVFCKERIIAQILSWVFLDASRNCNQFKFISPAFVVGSSGKIYDYDEQKINALKLDETIRKFRDKEINLIFATNVLEEGLDVPACNFVVRFDPILTYPSFGQSMGRARSKGAKFSVLTASNNVKETFEDIENFQQYGTDLVKYLIEDERNLVNSNEKDEGNASDDKEELLVNPGDPNSPKITLASSVQLVYQYCQFLSTDRIVSLEPTSWSKEMGGQDNKIMYKAWVALPMNAAVRDVIEVNLTNVLTLMQGKMAENKSSAKRHAFLETCKSLYLAGAFDEKLLPLRRVIPDQIKKFLDDIDVHESTQNGKKVGTRNNFQWYEKKVADSIENIKIGPLDGLKSYWIQFSLVKSTTDSHERKNLYCFDKHPHAFAILTKVNLDEVPPFCLYGRYGILKCSLVSIDLKQTKTLTENQFMKLEKFQKYVFSEFLNLNHPLMFASEEHHFLIAAIAVDAQTEWRVNWSMMEKVSTIDETIYGNKKTEQERLNVSFSHNELEDAVVVPWYSDKINFYCVCSIRDDISPSSPMDGKPNSKSFDEHYKTKGLKIVNRNQPLLRCAAIGRQLNYLTRKRNEDLQTKEDKKINHDASGLVDLIPELLNIYPVPASLLIQSKLVPSVMHRIHRLMLSAEIRMNVAQSFHWTAALDWKEDKDSAMEIDEPDVPESTADVKENKFPNGKTSDLKSLNCPCPCKKIKLDIEESPIVYTTGNKICAMEKLEKTDDNVAEIIHLDYIHPDEITPKEVEKHRAWKVNRELDEKQISRLDSLGKQSKCADYILPLIHSSEIAFESLDAETNFKISPGPSTNAIMEALTLSNANDVLSLENLEVIGDSFLKYCVSTHIFCEFRSFDEGNMTELRNKLVSNAHLFREGTKKDIGKYLAGGIFVPEYSWLPPGQKIPSAAGAAAVECNSNLDAFRRFALSKEQIENMSHDELVSWINKYSNMQPASKVKNEKYDPPKNSTFTHARLGDKSISDCVEALIGVYYMNGGQDAALAFMDWIGLRPPDINGQAVKYRRRQPPNFGNINCGSKTPEDYLLLLSDLETLIDYKFENKWLVVEAFSHAGCLRNTVTGCYQRLEFIGDAVLDFLVTNHIYKNHLRKSPGELTDLRSALVNNVTFGSLAVRYKFHNVSNTLMISKKLQDVIDKFEAYQNEKGHAVTGHFTLLNDFESPIAQEIEVPKVLGDIFESLAGAVFLDCKMSLDRTWTVFYRLMKNEIDEFTRKTPLSPIRELYEKFPGMKFVDVSEKSELKGMTTVSVELNGKVFYGTGTNKKQAKQATAKYALVKLSS